MALRECSLDWAFMVQVAVVASMYDVNNCANRFAKSSTKSLNVWRPLELIISPGERTVYPETYLIRMHNNLIDVQSV